MGTGRGLSRDLVQRYDGDVGTGLGGFFSSAFKNPPFRRLGRAIVAVGTLVRKAQFVKNLGWCSEPGY
jgi:hypothetical protein